MASPVQPNPPEGNYWFSNILSKTTAAVSSQVNYVTGVAQSIVSNIVPSTVANTISNAVSAGAHLAGNLLYSPSTSNATNSNDYMLALIKTSQKVTSSTVIPAEIPAEGVHSEPEARAILSNLKLSKNAIDNSVKVVSERLLEGVSLLIQRARDQFESPSLPNFVVRPFKENPESTVKIIPTDRKGIYTLEVTSRFEIQDLDESNLMASHSGNRLAKVTMQAKIDIEIMDRNPGDSAEERFSAQSIGNWKVSEQTQLIARPRLVIADFVKNFSFGRGPNAAQMQPLAIPSCPTPINVPIFFINDVPRQEMMVGNELILEKSPQAVCEAVYRFTGNNIEKTELACKFISQSTLTDGTAQAFGAIEDATTHIWAQLPHNAGTQKFRLYKDGGDLMLSGTVAFHQKSILGEGPLSPGGIHDVIIKSETIVNLTTGNATVNYTD
jgi:hypothetical protein